VFSHFTAVPSLSASSGLSSSSSSSGPSTSSAFSSRDGYTGTLDSSLSLDRQGKKETRKERKARKAWEEEHFEIDTPPSLKDLFDASYLEVKDETGTRHKFGDLVRERKTIVLFIRHFFCPLCAQFINSVLSQVSVEALEQANVDLIIIGNGSWKMLDGYKSE
jgi:hypothetical protein